MTATKSLENTPAPGISYFTPIQSTPAGTIIPSTKRVTPKLFTPLTIRGVTFQNRLWLSPLCQYSSVDGYPSDWHLAHLGGIIQRGPGLSFVEATGVLPEGRITPHCMGLWEDGHTKALRRIVEFTHGQNQKIAIQLNHAGRKSSTIAPWISWDATATDDNGGWSEKVYGPSSVPYREHSLVPKAMTIEQIEEVKQAFVDAARRAVDAGFDVVEIHAAHGYLLHQFYSPISNKRTDQYGGSFENRVRLLLEVTELVRAAIPETMPLFARISATDCLEGLEGEDVPESWKVVDSCRLAPLLAERGVDLLDVSSSGNYHQNFTGPRPGVAYQAPFSHEIKKTIGDKMLVSAVGGISNGAMSEQLLKDGLDAVFAGRYFPKNAGLVYDVAEELGVNVKMPMQIDMAFMSRLRDN
jgi:2,4-dienoyl-CoA reductase-like NADH-dependent reductase (Old Yellow Enzyme family)